METKTKEFIKNAIKNGYKNDNTCSGWDWMRANIQELSFIFDTEEYKQCNEMKYKCMPVIFSLSRVFENDLSELEKGVLGTAWFLNNEVASKHKKELKIKKFNDDGFFLIKNDPKLDKRKIEFIVDNSGDFLGGITKYKGKLSWSIADKRLMALESRCSRRGIWVDNCSQNVYIKLV